METITAYVENVFRTLPTTNAIMRAKEEILSNMLDKYNELKADGKSEHEAVGIVISEFGNIDELLEEMNLLPSTKEFEKNNGEDTYATTDSSLRFMSMAEVKEYIASYAKSAKLISLGVLLCIIGVVVLLLLNQLATDHIFSSGIMVDEDDILGFIGLFVFLAIAVGLFIVGGMNVSKFEYVSKGIRLDKETSAFLKAEKTALQPSFTKYLIIGVLMCVISPLFLIAGYGFTSDESCYPIIPFLLIIAFAVYILVRNGMRYGCITALLTEYKTTPQERKSNNIIGSLCGIIMLFATIIYLYMGFVQDKWQYAPIVYAIGGILCGIVAIIVNAVITAKN